MHRRFHDLLPLLLVPALMLSAGGCTPRKKTDTANTLNTYQPSRIKGLDPIYADDIYSGTEVKRAYEGLLQYHYLKRPYELAPNLAEAMPEVSADGRSYTFKLKKGVLFQDDPCFKETGGQGRELTADDVVYSFLRLVDPRLVSTGWWVLDGKIEGLNEWRESAKHAPPDYTKPITGLQALDRYTVRITLVRRSAQFLFALAMPFTSIVPREAVQHYGKEFLNHPVGTGPFRMAEFDRNSRLVWVKNPTYRKELYPSEGESGDKEAGLLEDAGKPIPFLDRIVVQVFDETHPQWLSFLSGKLDATGIPKDNFAEAVGGNHDLTPELQKKGIRLHKNPGIDIVRTTFNMKDPLVGRNKLLRQAISLAYDAEPYIELFFNGRAIPAQGPIPPGVAGFDPDFKNPYRQYNLEKAKELLAKAGYPGGKGLPPLEYSATADGVSRQTTEYLQKLLAPLGIKLKVNTYSWPEFQAGVKNARGQLWSYAWNADYPDAENFLQLFYSKNASPGPNDANYSNPEFDRLYEKALQLQDGPERTALYQQMVRIVVEDCPWIFAVHRSIFSLVQPWVKNYKRHGFEHNAMKYYRVDPALKKQ
ncbi:MAG: ABC transporter substrate-binding protein [Oligoflexia bacterium]|nr:ABC transporter substrate-binding protein [Oligoflexia bacterium]